LGKLLRRYWVPALLSWELPEPDCEPVRVKLLGEQLVAFRDTVGRVGLLDELCAHRCASLWLGRNEDGGLRCVFHGWKYDVDGNCVDMPNEPAETDFKDRVQQIAYPTVEMGGIIWTYMGPPELKPALPKFEFTQVPQTQRQVTKTWEECNWLQGLEGGIDSVHSSFLHRSITGVANKGGSRATGAVGLGEARPRPDRLRLPLRLYAPAGRPGRLCAPVPLRYAVDADPRVAGRRRLPGVEASGQRPLLGAHGRRKPHGVELDLPLDDTPLPESEWQARMPSYEGGEQLPGFRKARNRDINWGIDRQVQKTENFTGIDGVNTQDHAGAGEHGAHRGPLARAPGHDRQSGRHLAAAPAAVARDGRGRETTRPA
jgi:nitrite reductase/ring-hydroxylating ferredoxin subunit